MQITVPNTLENKPTRIDVNGVSYLLMPGETINVPDAVNTEMLRMIAAKAANPAPAVEEPFTDDAIAGILTRLAAVEDAVQAAAVKELPDDPPTNGNYTLKLVVDDGEGTLSWVSANTGYGGSN